MAKISKLQHWILKRAAERPDANQHNGCGLQTARVISEFYGFPMTNKGTYRFEPSKLDRKKFNAAKAAVSRTLKRLQDRELITVWIGLSRWTGLELTDKGREMVNTLPVSDKELTEPTEVMR